MVNIPSPTDEVNNEIIPTLEEQECVYLVLYVHAARMLSQGESYEACDDMARFMRKQRNLGHFNYPFESTDATNAAAAVLGHLAQEKFREKLRGWGEPM